MFFDTFKAYCDAKGVSPKRAVTEIGLSNSIATKWKKTGATPQGETLSKIAGYFGVSVDSLLTDVTKCEDCEFMYSSEFAPDVKAHSERHKKWQAAKEKFGIWNYAQREQRYEDSQFEKDASNPMDKRLEADERRMFAYFSRSVVESDFDLSHISFEEYIPYFLASQKHAFASDVYEQLVLKYGTKPGMSGTYWKSVPQKEAFKNQIKRLIPVKEEPEITFDDFTYAFLDESKELTEENKQKLLEMAKFFKQQQDKENNE